MIRPPAFQGFWATCTPRLRPLCSVGVSDPEEELQDAPSSAPDALCIENARSGSPAAREALVQHFSPALRRFLAARAGPALRRFARPEDLVQEILAGVFGALDRLRPGAGPEDFQALLFQHANWVVKRQGRHAREFTPESVLLRPEGARLDPAASAHSTGTVTRRDERRWLEERIGRLDEKYAAVLRLYLARKSFAEIALELGIREDAARKRFLRASQTLQRTEGAGEEQKEA